MKIVPFCGICLKYYPYIQNNQEQNQFRNMSGFFGYQMNHHVGSAFLALILFFSEIPSYPQSGLSFRQLSVNDGLSQNSAVSITQDRDGFLWIATQEGLNRYDGLEFVVYNRKFLDITEEKRLLLGKVFADSKNRIWIIPENSTPQLLDRQLNDFKSIEGITAANCIFEDVEQNILFGTLSGQLFQWNESLQKAEMLLAEPEKEFVAISQYDSKNVLITFKNSIALFHTESKQLVPVWQSESEINLSTTKADSYGNLWIGTLNHGIWVLPQADVKPIMLSEYFNITGNQKNMILDIMVDSKQRIWAATYGNGIALIQPDIKEIQYFSYSKQNPRSLHYNDILCIFEDYTGTLWFGSDGAGLSFYDAYLEKFNFFHNQQVPENIHIDVVRSIYVDEYEQVWIGTSGKGLTKYDPKNNSWKTYTHHLNDANSISSNRVMSLEGNGQGQLWIGYQDEGLSILDIKTEKFRHFDRETEISLPSTTIWKIMRDSQKRFWLGTRNDGLILFDPNIGVVKQYTHIPGNSNSIPDNNIRTIIESGKDEFWIGTENQGISKFNFSTSQFQNLQHDPNNAASISSNSIKSLYFSPEKDLWIGTNGAGLNKLDTKTMAVEVINTTSGLANDVIYGILSDRIGNLWLSSNKGITKVVTKKNETGSYPITNYSNYDGLATEFNTGAYFKTREGSLYFGSLEGFYWFNAEDIALNETQPKTAITELIVFDQAVKISDNLKLKHDQNTLTINMASLVFSSPGKNEFQYMMEGYEDSWINSGNNHQARYTNLSPGSYTFLVKSSNYDAIWSEEPVSLAFTILPPWYLSIWAKILYLFLFIFGIIWIYQYLKWRWQMQFNLKLKDDEAKRLQEIDVFKTNLFTNISHEFRTPLTLIAGPVERLISQSENPIVKSQLNLIKQNSQRLLNLVDQLLEVTKIKSGKHQLRVQKGNLGLLVQSIVSNFFYLAAEKDMRIISDVPLMTEVWFDSDKIEKILTNLLQNAIKYGKHGTDIHLTTFITDKQLEMKVSNLSIQKYSKEEIARLFDKFYKPDLKSEGFGIGLPLIKDLVELNHGKIKLKVEESTRSFTVNIQLPVDKFAFKPDEVIEEEKEYQIPIPSISPTSPNENSPMVLVIEDNDEVRTFIANELRHYYRVIEASDGKEGLFLAFKKIPDLIISDVMMPDKDGIELCETLKKDEKTSHIPIILLTAKSEEADKIKGLEVGADDYILKPFAVKQLLIRIEKLIELRRNLRVRYSGKTQIAPNEIALTSTDEKFLNKIQKIVDEDLADSNFTVDEFCKKLGMSRMQLHRKLTALTGLSTTAFIRDQRLRLALQRLEKSGESISEIAYAVGFSSPSYFIKCFRETYQMTPSDYLEREK